MKPKGTLIYTLKTHIDMYICMCYKICKFFFLVYLILVVLVCYDYRAAAALMMGEDLHKFGRSRLERNDFSMNGVNPASRQIYLTFPADSTFREEDVSNYFRFLYWLSWFGLFFA